MRPEMMKYREEATPTGDTGTGAPPPPPAPVVDSPVPDPAPSTDVVDSKVFSDFAAEDLGEVDDGDSVPSVPPVARQAPEPTTAPKPEVPPVTAPTPPAPPVSATPTPPVQTPTPEPVAAPKPPEAAPTPPPPVETPEQISERIKAERNKFVENMTNEYAVPEADQAALLTEPEKVLPRMLAAMHARVMEHVANYMQQALPTMMTTHQETVRTQQERTNAFFEAWPELNKKEHIPTVARVLQAWRQANPDAKPEDIIREGGIAALVSLRLPIPQRIMAQHNANAPDATKPAAFAPVANSGAASLPPTKPSDNVFTVIAQEDLLDGA